MRFRGLIRKRNVFVPEFIFIIDIKMIFSVLVFTLFYIIKEIHQVHHLKLKENFLLNRTRLKLTLTWQFCLSLATDFFRVTSSIPCMTLPVLFMLFLIISFISNGFNLMLYGLGSKRILLEKFRGRCLGDWPQLVINGFFPSLTIKSVSVLI